VGVSFNRKSKGAGKSEISQLNHVTWCVHEQVLWFQVAMENSVLMQVDERLEDLVQEALRYLLR